LCFENFVIREIADMVFQRQFEIATTGRGMTDITRKISKTITESDIHTGLCHVFIHHTSASLIICENADPRVRVDLETVMARLAPDGDPAFIHDDEGPDDMPAHVRSVLTQTGLSIPVIAGRAGLGTWQGLFLWEHRTHPHHRRVTVTVTD
jgi:secondary thiamine-phosphate synthase enzyme